MTGLAGTTVAEVERLLASRDPDGATTLATALSTYAALFDKTRAQIGMIRGAEAELQSRAGQLGLTVPDPLPVLAPLRAQLDLSHESVANRDALTQRQGEVEGAVDVVKGIDGLLYRALTLLGNNAESPGPDSERTARERDILACAGTLLGSTSPDQTGERAKDLDAIDTRIRSASEGVDENAPGFAEEQAISPLTPIVRSLLRAPFGVRDRLAAVTHAAAAERAARAREYDIGTLAKLEASIPADKAGSGPFRWRFSDSPDTPTPAGPAVTDPGIRARPSRSDTHFPRRAPRTPKFLPATRSSRASPSRSAPGTPLGARGQRRRTPTTRSRCSRHSWRPAPAWSRSTCRISPGAARGITSPRCCGERPPPRA